MVQHFTQTCTQTLTATTGFVGSSTGGGTGVAAATSASAAGAGLTGWLTLKYALVALVSVLILAGATVGIVELTQGSAHEQAEAVTLLNFDLAFVGGDCDCGHLNPNEAQLVVDGDAALSTVNWQISARGESGVLYAGEGDVVTLPLTELYNLKADGDYELVFTIQQVDGQTSRVSRDFHIDTGDILPGEYL
jgi:hypothetical protein